MVLMHAKTLLIALLCLKYVGANNRYDYKDIVERLVKVPFEHRRLIEKHIENHTEEDLAITAKNYLITETPISPNKFKTQKEGFTHWFLYTYLQSKPVSIQDQGTFLNYIKQYEHQNFDAPIDSFFKSIGEFTREEVTHLMNIHSYDQQEFLRELWRSHPATFKQILSYIDYKLIDERFVAALFGIMEYHVDKGGSPPKEMVLLLKEFLHYRTQGTLRLVSLFDLKKGKSHVTHKNLLDPNNNLHKYPALYYLLPLLHVYSKMGVILGENSYSDILEMIESGVTLYELVPHYKENSLQLICTYSVVDPLLDNSKLDSCKKLLLLRAIAPSITDAPLDCITDNINDVRKNYRRYMNDRSCPIESWPLSDNFLPLLSKNYNSQDNWAIYQKYVKDKRNHWKKREKATECPVRSIERITESEAYSSTENSTTSKTCASMSKCDNWDLTVLNQKTNEMVSIGAAFISKCRFSWLPDESVADYFAYLNKRQKPIPIPVLTRCVEGYNPQDKDNWKCSGLLQIEKPHIFESKALREFVSGRVMRENNVDRLKMLFRLGLTPEMLLSLGPSYYSPFIGVDIVIFLCEFDDFYSVTDKLGASKYSLYWLQLLKAIGDDLTEEKKDSLRHCFERRKQAMKSEANNNESSDAQLSNNN